MYLAPIHSNYEETDMCPAATFSVATHMNTQKRKIPFGF